MAVVGSWLDRYWFVSIPAYPAAVLGLSLLLRPSWDNAQDWANIVTLAFGMAAGLGVLAGVIALVILSVPAKIRKIQSDRDNEWIAWEKERAEAEKNGQPFTKPSPAERDAVRNKRG